jgi:nucleoid-associated protein YgaU
MRAYRLLLIPLFALLSGCNYLHFGKAPLPADQTVVARENAELQVEKKILKEELALARRETAVLRSTLESGKLGAGNDALTARLTETTRELAALRASYAKLDAERARLAAAPASNLNITSADSAANADLSTRLAATQEKLAESLRAYTTLIEETTGLRAEVQRVRTESNILTAQVRNLTAENDRARSALAQLNTELLAQKNAQTQATREAEAARAQLSTVLAASTATATSLGDARTQTATGVATLSAPGLPDSESPPTARLATNRERVAAAANQPVPAATGPRTHLVAPGETLQTIAKKYYGRPERWRLIYAANNAQLSLGRPLEVGTILEVPER